MRLREKTQQNRNMLNVLMNNKNVMLGLPAPPPMEKLKKKKMSDNIF